MDSSEVPQRSLKTQRCVVLPFGLVTSLELLRRFSFQSSGSVAPGVLTGGNSTTSHVCCCADKKKKNENAPTSLSGSAKQLLDRNPELVPPVF